MIKKLLAVAVSMSMTAIFFIDKVYSEISYSSLNLNSNNELLFKAKQKIPGVPEYETLFKTNIKGKESLDILTCFPEKIEMMEDGKSFEVRNRYGVAKYDFSKSSLEWISKADYIPSGFSRTSVALPSPDGNWACFIRKTGTATGNLILKNMKTYSEVRIATSIPYSYDKIAAKWSPDSSILLYESNDCVYFIQPENAFSKVKVSDDIRKIGKGSINSVAWSQAKSFYYISGDLVYKISETGLYTRGLYSALLGVGEAVARIPFEFNCKTD
nr:hypothetical protein [Treponema sp.]